MITFALLFCLLFNLQTIFYNEYLIKATFLERKSFWGPHFMMNPAIFFNKNYNVKNITKSIKINKIKKPIALIANSSKVQHHFKNKAIAILKNESFQFFVWPFILVFYLITHVFDNL